MYSPPFMDVGCPVTSTTLCQNSPSGLIRFREVKEGRETFYNLLTGPLTHGQLPDPVVQDEIDRVSRGKT